MAPKRPQPEPDSERRMARERRKATRPAVISPDLVQLRLAQLLAVFTGVFVGFFVAYIISYTFITPMEELSRKAQQAITDAQQGLSQIEPQYNRLRKEAQLIEGANGTIKGVDLQTPQDESAATAVPGATTPTGPATPPPGGITSPPGSASSSPPAAAPSQSHANPPSKRDANPRISRLFSPDEENTLHQFLSISRQKKNLESQVATRTAEIKEYGRNILALNLLSIAVLAIMGFVGYLLYPLYYALLGGSIAYWGAVIAQRRLRTGPLLIGFFMGMFLGVVVLSGLFTIVSTQYTFLSLPPFRLLFGAFVTLVLGFIGALVGASYFSPPPPEADPYEEYRRPAAPSLLDSSVLIDGRIYEVAANGFIGGALIVPTSVLDELQALADSGDERKRGKGKRGLDLVNKMKADSRLDLQVFDDSSFDRHGRGADEHLIRVAQAMGAHVVTNDFNLNRVASARDVRVINLNALANAVKTNHVPGDYIEIDIADRGKQRGQGVGYLPDGTMVVIEDGEPHIGKVKTIRLTSISQTQAGRLLFGRVDAAEGDHGNGRHSNGGSGGGGR